MELDIGLLAAGYVPRRSDRHVPADAAQSAAFSLDGQRIVTSDDRSARVWDAQTNQLLFTLPHGDTVYDAHYSSDGTHLVTAGGDGAVRIWDAARGVRQRELTHDGMPSRYFSAAISPDGKLVTAIDTSGAVAHVWDADTGAQLAELRNDASEFPTIAFSADGRWLATSGGDDVRVFDTTTWAQALTIAGPGIINFSFDPTGPRLATGSARGDAAIWEIPSGAQIRHLRESGEPVDAVAFSPSGEFVATASRDGAEQIWDASSGALQNQFNPVRSKILSIEFDSTSKLVVAAGASGAVVVTDVAQGMTVAMLEGPRGIVMAAHFDPEVAFARAGHDVISGATDGSLLVTRDSREPIALPASSGGIDAAALLPDGRAVVVDARGRLRIGDPDRGTVLADLAVPTRVRMLRPSPDGIRLIAIPRYTGPAGLWDLERYRPITQLEGHAERVYSARFVAGGRAIVTAGADGAVRLWNGHTGQLRQVFRGGSRFLADATISPDGLMIVAGGGDGLLRFWDVSSGRLLWTLPAHKSHVVGLHFEGNSIVTRGFAGDVSRWTLPSPAQVIELAPSK